MDQLKQIYSGKFLSDNGLREIEFSFKKVKIKFKGKVIDEFYNSGQFYDNSNLFTSDQAYIYYYMSSNNRITVGVIRSLAIVERWSDSEISYSRI